MATRGNQSACIAHETHRPGHCGKRPLRWATECSKGKTIQDIDSLYSPDDSVVLHAGWVGEWARLLPPQPLTAVVGGPTAYQIRGHTYCRATTSTLSLIPRCQAPLQKVSAH